MRRLVILYWSEDPANMRIGIRQHLDSFSADRADEVLYYNARHGAPAWLGSLPADAFVLHTTLLCMRWSHLFPAWKWQIRWVNDIKCLKIAMPQDEYDHSEVLDEWLAEMGVSIVITNFGVRFRSRLYPSMQHRATFVDGLTGYVDSAAARSLAPRVPAISERLYDVVYRASHLPFWFGSQGQLKHRVGDVVKREAVARGLRVDISTRNEDTLLGNSWLDFLMSGRVVIGCEGGSSVLDRRGEVRARIQKLLRDNPTLTFDEVSRQMPEGWDSHEFFAVSPRHFEAVVTKTCQILVEGSYDGILVSGRHYIALRKDFANLSEVLEQVRKPDTLQDIADRAYAEIYESDQYTYATLIRRIRAAADRFERRRERGWDRLAWRAGTLIAPLQVNVDIRRPRLGSITRIQRSTLLKGAVAMGLIIRSRGLRLFALRFVRSAAIRKSVGIGQLLQDLLRLAIIEQAQADALTAYVRWPFQVSPYFDELSGRLVLKSWAVSPDGPQEPADPDWLVVEGALHDGTVRSVVWDHSALGAHVPYGLSPSHWLSISLGGDGVYSFEAVGGLLRREPETRRALLQMISPIPGQAKGDLHRQRAGFNRAGMTRTGWRKAGLALRLSLASAPLRSLLFISLRRRARSFGAVLRDLLRLAIIQQVQAGSPTTSGEPFRVVPHFDQRSRSLTLTSSGLDSPESSDTAVIRSALEQGNVARLIWDHSRVGSDVRYGKPPADWLNVSVGTNGIYEFGEIGSMLLAEPDVRRHLIEILANSLINRKGSESDVLA